MMIATSRLWGLRFTLPAIKGDIGDRRYTKNCTVTCICDTLEESLSMVRQQYPDAIVWAVNHRGQEDTYFQKSHTVLIASPDEKGVPRGGIA